MGCGPLVVTLTPLIGLSDALWGDVIAARHPCDLVRLPVTRLTGAARS